MHSRHSLYQQVYSQLNFFRIYATEFLCKINVNNLIIILIVSKGQYKNLIRSKKISCNSTDLQFITQHVEKIDFPAVQNVWNVTGAH